MAPRRWPCANDSAGRRSSSRGAGWLSSSIARSSGVINIGTLPVDSAMRRYTDPVSDVGRALEQIAEIHEHLAKAEIYRGWRSAPVASSGLVGLAAAAWQSGSVQRLDPRSFTAYWLAVGSPAAPGGRFANRGALGPPAQGTR